MWTSLARGYTGTPFHENEYLAAVSLLPCHKHVSSTCAGTSESELKCCTQPKRIRSSVMAISRCQTRRGSASLVSHWRRVSGSPGGPAGYRLREYKRLLCAGPPARENKN